jgi:hypothetical protein
LKLKIQDQQRKIAGEPSEKIEHEGELGIKYVEAPKEIAETIAKAVVDSNADQYSNR